MVTFARRGAMPHHHVPEPKETPLVVDRLRLELNRTVRRTVTEAVDAVWVAFEDKLTQLAAPTTLPPDDYELFYSCCSRLAKFIDSNMDTTPGFLEEMDRLILTCHSGATGTIAREVMTKDLNIRRGNKLRDRKKHVSVKTNREITGTAEPPVISPPNDTLDREEGSSDEEIEMAATVGTESRQWVTRKRLSTRRHSSTRQIQSKRLKRPLTSEWGRDECEGEAKKTRTESETKKSSKLTQNLSMQVQAAKRSSRRTKCVRRVETDFGDDRANFFSCHKMEKSRNTAFAKGIKRDGAFFRNIRVERLRGKRRNLTGFPNDSRGSNDIKGNQTRSKSKQAEKCQSEKSNAIALELDIVTTEGNDLIPEMFVTEPFDREETGQWNTIDEREQLPHAAGSQCDVEVVTQTMNFANVDEEKNTKINGCSIGGLEREITKPVAENCAHLIGYDGEKQDKDCSESVDCLSHEQQTDVVQASDALTKVAADNDGAHITCAETIQDGAKLLDHDEQVVLDEDAGCIPQGPGDAIQKYHADRKGLQYPVVADTHSVEASVFDNFVGNLEVGSAAQSDKKKDNSSKSDHEPPVPGLCDAGMRTPQQVSHFKACLRKSIQCVDAFQCSPPPGKRCVRNCEKIRSRKCTEGAPCRDQLCRNWHKAEAHTERCKNPLCEFTNRIILREIVHQIARQDVKTELLQFQWEEKRLEQAVASTQCTNEQFKLEQLRQLGDDIVQLDRSIDDAKDEAESLRSARRVRLANLSAIGIKPQDDIADGFPDFETHYR